MNALQFSRVGSRDLRSRPNGLGHKSELRVMTLRRDSLVFSDVFMTFSGFIFFFFYLKIINAY